MNTLSAVRHYEIWSFLLGVVTIVAYQLLTGKINMNGLLYEKNSRHGFSPGRLQLLLFTLGGAVYYVLRVLGNPELGKFPEVPNEFLLLLGGSNVFYLGGKFYSLLSEKLDSFLPRLQAPQDKQTPN